MVGVMEGVIDMVLVAEVEDKSFTMPDTLVCTLCTPGVLSTNAFTVISPPVAISNAVTVIDHGGLVTVPIRAVLDSISL